MASKLCLYCGQSGYHECACTYPYTIICRDHLEGHLSLQGDHNLKKPETPSSRPNNKARTELINKISQIKAEALNNKKFLIDSTDQLIKKLLQKNQKIVEQLNGFVEACEKVILEILSINTIVYKQFYNPLENALISNNIEKLLSSFYAPEVKFKETELFEYVPSLFPHFLYNYSEFTFGFPNRNAIKFYPSGKEIKSKMLFSKSRALSLHNNSILITGPDDESFILNMNNESISELPLLNQPRKLHAMAWIDDEPAVIGGESNDVFLSSVETLTCYG